MSGQVVYQRLLRAQPDVVRRYKEIECPEPACEAQPGQRCLSISGRSTQPHAKRIYKIMAIAAGEAKDLAAATDRAG